MELQARYQPYVSAEGQPQLAEAVVLLLDLLGTSAATVEDAERNLAVTERALTRAMEWAEGGDDSSTVVKWFSDNLAMADPWWQSRPEPHTLGFHLITAGWVQLELASMGFFSRGGMALGPFYASEMFVYGPALVQAYEIESNSAIYPRVVLSDNLAGEALAELERFGGGRSEVHRNLLAVDRDGKVFLNYLASTFDEPAEVDAYLRVHKDHVEARLAEYSGRPHIHVKYQWLADYHDRFCWSTIDVEQRPDLIIQGAEGPKLEQFGGSVPIPKPEDNGGLPI